LQLGLESGIAELGMGSLVSGQDRLCTSVGQWDSKDAIAVIIVDAEDVVVASTGWSDEAASEIHVCLSSGFHCAGITIVGAFAVVEGRGKAVIIGWHRWCW